MVTYGWPATSGEWGSHLLCTGLGPKRGAAPSSPLFSPPLQSSCAQRKENCEGSLSTPFLSKGRRKTQLPSASLDQTPPSTRSSLGSAVKTPAQAGLAHGPSGQEGNLSPRRYQASCFGNKQTKQQDENKATPHGGALTSWSASEQG